MSPLNVLFCKLALTLHLIYQGVYTSIQFSYQGKPNIKWESTYIYMCRNYYRHAYWTCEILIGRQTAS